MERRAGLGGNGLNTNGVRPQPIAGCSSPSAVPVPVPSAAECQTGRSTRRRAGADAASSPPPRCTPSSSSSSSSGSGSSTRSGRCGGAPPIGAKYAGCSGVESLARYCYSACSPALSDCARSATDPDPNASPDLPGTRRGRPRLGRLRRTPRSEGFVSVSAWWSLRRERPRMGGRRVPTPLSRLARLV